MNIAGREIGPGHPPYIIAEVSCNHGGELSRALELIDAAKACGADAVKFQCYTADTITIDCDREEFTVTIGPWKGRNLHELYRETQTPFDWFPEIKARAEKIGITWFASVFDRTAVDLMVKLGAPAIKIASLEIVDTPLIKYAAATGKPMIISTGVANDYDIDRASLAFWEEQVVDNLVMLHCVSGYPTPPEEANLFRMVGMWRSDEDGPVGISDHSVGYEVPIAATALGACIIEKHFRLQEHPRTEDAPFSLDQYGFTSMTEMVRNTWAAMQPREVVPGYGIEISGWSEVPSWPLRRSLFAVRGIKKGEKFTSKNVRSIRPGHGLPPAAIDQIIGKCAARSIERGEPMAWDMVGGAA